MLSARPGCARHLLVAELRPGGQSSRLISQIVDGQIQPRPGGERIGPFVVKLALLGTAGGTHVGGSFARGAAKLGIESSWFDADKASAGPWLLRSLFWHLAGRRPLYLNRFSSELVEACARA